LQLKWDYKEDSRNLNTNNLMWSGEVLENATLDGNRLQIDIHKNTKYWKLRRLSGANSKTFEKAVIESCFQFCKRLTALRTTSCCMDVSLWGTVDKRDTESVKIQFKADSFYLDDSVWNASCSCWCFQHAGTGNTLRTAVVMARREVAECCAERVCNLYTGHFILRQSVCGKGMIQSVLIWAEGRVLQYDKRYIKSWVEGGGRKRERERMCVRESFAKV
jgi:hypothetical protein